jgi:hypothetical protein
MEFKLLILLFIAVFVFIIFTNSIEAIVCTIRSSSCSSGEFPIFSTYQRNDTHAGNYSEYPQNIICCSDQYLTSSSFKKFCGIGEFSFLAFYNYTDSHVETFNNSVLELSFEDNSSGLAFDSSGNGNHGKIYGPILVDGRYGKALSFDGVDDYVEIGDVLGFEGTAPFSVILWVYDAGYNGVWARLVSKENITTLRQGWLIVRDESVNQYKFERWRDGIANAVAVSYTPNQWNFIAFTYNGSHMKSYLNGVLINTTSSTLSLISTGTPLRLGRISNGASFFNGTIDEVRIYNRALTEEEIKHSYYEYRSCVSSPWICNVRTSCLSGETCVTSIFNQTNTHVGECGYYNYQLCCKREDVSPAYLNVGQNSTFIFPGKPIKLFAEWKDNGNVSYAILSTNETGYWENKTSYGSPLNVNHFWSWSNFTWQNSSISSGNVIAWRIYANDTAGNWNVTEVNTFTVSTPINLKDTTGAIPLKGWGENFTFKANVSHAEGFTVNVSLWFAYSSSGPWYFLDSKNCTACSSETQLIFSSNYFDCSKFTQTSNGIFYYKFNATDYSGGFNETSATSFQTRKDNTIASIKEGNQSSVDRYGASFVTLKVGIVDSDTNTPLSIGRNCTIFVGSKKYNLQTDVTGNCTLNFNPDCSANYFSPGIYDWLGGINETDVCYSASNSTKTNVTVWGQLFSTLENPPQDSTFSPGSQINVTGNVTSDCSQEGLITGATSTFELKVNTTTIWEGCTPVNEFSAGYYNCTWNSTGKPGGYYDVRFNSSKESAYYRNSSSTYLSRFFLQALVSMEVSSKLSEGIFFTNDEGSDTNRQLPVKITQWNNATWNYHGWWNSTWNKRKRILINNSANPNELTDYQVFVNITYATSMQPDFSDLRFTWYNFSSRKEEEISYWIENYTLSNYANIWIKVPIIRASNYETVYVYYGNTTPVNSSSNGTLTFGFFDDFLGTSLDTSKWYVASGTSYTVSNSILKITVGAIGLQSALSFNLNSGYLTEARIQYNSNSESTYSGVLEISSSRFTAGSNANADATILYMVDSSASSTSVKTWIGNGSTASYNIANGASVFTMALNTWYVLGDESTPSTAAVWKDYSRLNSYSISWAKNIRYLSLGAFNGNGASDIKDTSYDWIRVRKYTSPEPKTIIGEEESKPSEIYQTEFWIKNTGTNPEDFCLKGNSDLTCNSGVCTGITISIDNVAWNNSTFNNATYPAYDTTKRLSLSYQKVAFSINPNNFVYLRFWLFVPPGKPSGIYNTTFNVRAVEAGNVC